MTKMNTIYLDPILWVDVADQLKPQILCIKQNTYNNITQHLWYSMYSVFQGDAPSNVQSSVVHSVLLPIISEACRTIHNLQNANKITHTKKVYHI